MWWGSSGKKWTDRDLLLSLALTAYEDSLCGGCGHPRDQVYNPDADGWFEAAEVTCAACAAKDKHGEDNRKKPTPGVKVFTVSTLPAGHQLQPWSPADPDGRSGPEAHEDPDQDHPDPQQRHEHPGI